MVVVAATAALVCPHRMPCAACAEPTTPPRSRPSALLSFSLQSVDRVTADDVDTLATSAFPLCMQIMHQSLRDKHKLKHLGRLQYGLFLKGVGEASS